MCSAASAATPHRLNPDDSGFLTLPGLRHPNSGVSRWTTLPNSHNDMVPVMSGCPRRGRAVLRASRVLRLHNCIAPGSCDGRGVGATAREARAAERTTATILPERTAAAQPARPHLGRFPGPNDAAPSHSGTRGQVAATARPIRHAPGAHRCHSDRRPPAASTRGTGSPGDLGTWGPGDPGTRGRGNLGVARGYDEAPWFRGTTGLREGSVQNLSPIISMIT